SLAGAPHGPSLAICPFQCILSRLMPGFGRSNLNQQITLTMPLNNAPDLTKRPPRSPRVKLGGYVILPRLLDKCRATIAGKPGEYHYACPVDQRFLGFVGIDPEALKNEVATGKGDGDILEWINANAKHPRTEG